MRVMHISKTNFGRLGDLVGKNFGRMGDLVQDSGIPRLAWITMLALLIMMLVSLIMLTSGMNGNMAGNRVVKNSSMGDLVRDSSTLSLLVITRACC